MKYESNILKRLIDTYGVIGNPRYLSEIIKEYIVRGKELYPQLFTYQSDWLTHIDEFGLTPDYVVSYTGQQIYAPHTKERPVKSAILSGQTLVNLVNYKGFFDGREINSDNTFKIDATKPFQELIIGKEYTFITYVSQTQVGNISSVAIEFNEKDIGTKKALCVISNPINGVNKVKFTVPSNYGSYLHSYIKTSSIGGSVTVKGMIIEGDLTQEDIPYFTGMQSVKLPVLTTTGKNLFDYTKCSTTDESISITNNGLIISTWAKGVPFNHNFTPNTTYTTQAVYEIIEESIGASDLSGGKILLSNGKDYIALLNDGGQTSTFTTPSNIADFNQLLFYSHGGGGSNEGIIKLTNIQIEQGTQVTSYEPYKSNILTVNEDVELRGIGDVKDELDCVTGQVTERIGEVVLDGSDDLVYEYESNSNDTTTMVYITIPNTNRFFNFYNDKLPHKYVYNSASEIEGIFSDWYGLYIRLLNVKLSSPNSDGVKEYLQSNPITVQYEFKTESVKTVDLTILDQNGQNVEQLMSFNGGTHFNTGSLEGSLLPSISVTVETDLEETLNLCSMDGNTL